MALLPLDDLVAAVREFINPDASRAGWARSETGALSNSAIGPAA